MRIKASFWSPFCIIFSAEFQSMLLGSSMALSAFVLDPCPRNPDSHSGGRGPHCHQEVDCGAMYPHTEFLACYSYTSQYLPSISPFWDPGLLSLIPKLNSNFLPAIAILGLWGRASKPKWPAWDGHSYPRSLTSCTRRRKYGLLNFHWELEPS